MKLEQAVEEVPKTTRGTTIANEIRRKVGDYCVEEVLGMTLSLENSIEEYLTDREDLESWTDEQIAVKWLEDADWTKELEYYCYNE
jgi:hypothetical protein